MAYRFHNGDAACPVIMSPRTHAAAVVSVWVALNMTWVAFPVGPEGPLGPEGPVGPDGPETVEFAPEGPDGPDGPLIVEFAPLGPDGPLGPEGPETVLAYPDGAKIKAVSPAVVVNVPLLATNVTVSFRYPLAVVQAVILNVTQFTGVATLNTFMYPVIVLVTSSRLSSHAVTVSPA